MNEHEQLNPNVLEALIKEIDTPELEEIAQDLSDKLDVIQKELDRRV